MDAKRCFFCLIFAFLALSTGFISKEHAILIEDIAIEDDLKDESTWQNNTELIELIKETGTWRLDEGWEALYSTLGLSPQELPPPEENINLYVPKYFQNKQPWSNDIMRICPASLLTAWCKGGL